MIMIIVVKEIFSLFSLNIIKDVTFWLHLLLCWRYKALYKAKERRNFVLAWNETLSMGL